MRVAIQSLLWGVDTPNLETVLRETREAGYDGIEAAIAPEYLSSTKANLIALLQRYKLALVGIARGSFEEKVAFVRWYRAELDGLFIGMSANDPIRKIIEPGVEYPYVYIDEMEDVEKINPRPAPENDPAFSKEAKPPYADVTFALHPHMFKSVQTLKEAERALRRYPQLKFLPDTAHAFIAGDSPVAVVRNHYDRLIGVHIKDWAAEYGRSYHFYARGFVDLGKGDVPLIDVFAYLKRRGYREWIVVEKDKSANPVVDAKSNREWLLEYADI
jgi:sugar phosphate isomerase/epimerase